MTDRRYYKGEGNLWDGDWRKDLPQVSPAALRAPEGYLAPPDLAAAVNVALTLGMPLLLTGEPGSGKSRLAHSVAWELGLGKPLEFSVKAEAQGRDLFYGFDTVGRFHASQTPGEDVDPALFLTFNALGQAILYAKPTAYALDELKLPPGRVGHPGEPRRSLVLIDEIDKAPRDVPNDILTEIEGMRFRIPELEAAHGREVEIHLGPDEDLFRPIVFITSNSEKALPDAFLRRCVYYHLSLPPYADENGTAGPAAVTVEAILDKRLGQRFRGQSDTLVREAVALFRFLRDRRHGLERRPALAELLNWLDLLLPREGDGDAPTPSLDALGEGRLLLSVKTTLLKKQTDQGRAAGLIEEWRAGRRP